MTQDQDAPENARPLLQLAAGGVIMAAIFICGMVSGVPIGESKAWTETEALQDSTRVALTEALRVQRLLAPYLWLRACHPDPVANVKLLDEQRRLVTLACGMEVEE